MNDHVRHLEEKIAYLEHHVTQQDKVMLEFAEDLARVRAELATLRERSGAGRSPESGDEARVDERPPHY